MTVLSTIHPTLLDITSRLGPDNKVAVVGEILNETNEILHDMPWIEGNLPTGNVSVIRTGLPEATWRKMYGGVQPTKSTTAKITDTCGMLETYGEVDKAIADLGGNSAAFRLTETVATIEGMNQQFINTLFYGDESLTPERFTGFAPRFNDLSAANADNILTSATNPDGNDNTSIYLIGWGANSVFGTYPKGSTAGLQVNDKGQVTIENVDGNGGRMEAYRTHFKWDNGLVVKDWRYLVRIQIDQEDLVKNAATGPDLIDLMSQATELLPAGTAYRPVFYANRKVRSYLKRQIANKVASSTLTMENVGGKPVVAFEGIPVKRCDGLLNTESGIS